MKKIILDVLDKDFQYLICPICRANFNNQKQSITCLNNHTFDKAKNGYINLSLTKFKTFYQRELFKARKTVTQNSFFDSLKAVIVKKLRAKCLKKERLIILDAGCGEGSLFLSILLSLKSEGLVYSAIGIDSSKEAVKLASKEDNSVLWLVSDVSNMPLADNSVDIILNILSPANYSEFNRVLKDGGIVIKAIPNQDYLKEFRQEIGKQEYSNNKVWELFATSLTNVEKHNVRYAKEINQEQRQLVWKMTPLTLTGKIENSLNAIQSVTVDLTILIGYKKTTTR